MFKLKTLTDDLHKLLGRRGYNYTYVCRSDGMTTTYKSIFNNSKLIVDYDEIRKFNGKWMELVGYKINKINDTWIHTVEQANELLKKLIPFNYRVLPYSVHSTNYSYLKGISNRMSKLGATIRDPADLMEKLYTVDSYRRYIQIIKLNYPNENPLAYFAMLCKVTVMRGQSRNILREYTNEGGFFKSVEVKDLHRYMKQHNLCWTNSWRYIRAIQIIRNEPRVRKENVIFSEKARSLTVDYTIKDYSYDGKSWCLADKFKTRKPKLPVKTKAELENERNEKLIEDVKASKSKCLSLVDLMIGTDLQEVKKGVAHRVGVIEAKNWRLDLSSAFKYLFLVILKKPEISNEDFDSEVKKLGLSEEYLIILKSDEDVKKYRINLDDIIWLT